MADHTLHGVSPFLLVFALTAAGILAGKLFEKCHLPHISGQLLIGIIVGPSVLGFVTHHQLQDLQIWSQVALGFMTFSIGTHLNYKMLHNSWRRIAALAICDVLFAFIFVALATRYALSETWSIALMLGCIAVATAPGTIVSLMQQKRARGVLVKTLLGVVAINNVMAILLYETLKTPIVETVTGQGSNLSIWEQLLMTVVPLIVSLSLGLVTGITASLISRKVHHKAEFYAIAILLVASNLIIAEQWAICSPLLMNLAAGATLGNNSPHTRRILELTDNLCELLFSLFFVLAGTHLDLSLMKTAGITGAVFVIARAAGKVLSAHAGGQIAKCPQKVKSYLGMALIPQAGLAIGLVVSLNTMPGIADSEFGSFVSTVVLAAVAVNEMIGPFTTSKSFDLAHETGQANPRLLDFLHEEYITFLDAKNKQEAIRQITQFFVRAHHFEEIEMEVLYETLLLREEQGSTAIGARVAIPHVRLPYKGNQVLGAIGVCKRPVDFDAIDEEPVDTVIMLIAPHEEGSKLFKVTTHIAKIFCDDPSFHKKIAKCTNAAEVYEILQSKDVRKLNYFLDDQVV